MLFVVKVGKDLSLESTLRRAMDTRRIARAPIGFTPSLSKSSSPNISKARPSIFSSLNSSTN